MVEGLFLRIVVKIRVDAVQNSWSLEPAEREVCRDARRLECQGILQERFEPAPKHEDRVS